MPYREREVGDCIFNFTCVPGTLPHKLKVVIAGNHDMTLDLEMVRDRRQYLSKQFSIKEAVSTSGTEERTRQFIKTIRTCATKERTRQFTSKKQ